MLIKIMRPDRVTQALRNYVRFRFGNRYIDARPFDIYKTNSESTKANPLFFVLFPGVDPIPAVLESAEKIGKTINNGKLISISMGQGMEDLAINEMKKQAEAGDWIFLQNCHLMTEWMKDLERELDETMPITHKDFRCFLSSEPPGPSQGDIIPQAVLQNSIKISNEAPASLKDNLNRAFANFNQERCDASSKGNEFKALLFALCFYHSLILGRRKFGAQGFSIAYEFNEGDLNQCANVLTNYLEKFEVVPYDDLKYVFGEIMYGGHITDQWDRNINNTYLEKLIKKDLLSNGYLVQPFRSPDPEKHDYAKYKEVIEEKLPKETPQVFGLHPNAEIGYLTVETNILFQTMLEVQGGGGGGGGSGDGGEGEEGNAEINLVNLYLERTPVNLDMIEILEQLKDKARTPYEVITIQECERMNILLNVIRGALSDLRMGLTGELNQTGAMEMLLQNLLVNKVPELWVDKYAYETLKPADMFFIDLASRVEQYFNWTEMWQMPKSVCLPYLFNPMSFITAVVQSTAREKNLPLDNMCIQTNVMPFFLEEVTGKAEEGYYIHGLFIEGATWELGQTDQEGYLIPSILQVRKPAFPVINTIAVILKDKRAEAQLITPVFVTSERGETFVTDFNLTMESDEFDKKIWILAGVALLLTND